MFLSSGDGYVGELLQLHQGCQGPFRGSRGKVGFLSRRRSGKGPHLVLRGESPGFFSSCGRKLGVPLELRRGPQGPACVALGKTSLHTSCEGPLGIPLQSLLGPRSSSVRDSRTSGFLCCAGMDLGFPPEFPQGSQALSRVETCKSALLPSWKSNVRLPVRLTLGSVSFSRGATEL